MPKQVIVIMDDHYPFGQCEESTNQNTRVLVRKIYQVSVQQRNKLLEKATILRKLKSEQLIKVQSVLEEEESIHFLFQYVPIRLETWISNINDQFIENFRDQLIKFSSYLANNYININFKLKNIGMDHNYGAKYFLDPSFTFDQTVNKQRLKSQYIRDITNLFKPYIQNHEEEQIISYQQAPGNKINADNIISAQQSSTTIKNKNFAISPPTYNDDSAPTNHKTKEKLQKYYQQMNASMDVENEKILQEFMNVLDDEEDSEHMPTIIPVQQNRAVPPEYQYGYNKNKQQQRSRESPIKNSLYTSSELNNQNGNQYSQKKIEQQHTLKNYSQNVHNDVRNSKQQSMMAPVKMGKNHIYENEKHQYQEEQVLWRDPGDDLQNRIKNAIQNSRSAIQRFKSMKEGNKV